MSDTRDVQMCAALCPPVKLSTRLREISSREPLRAMAHRRCVPPRSITSAGKASPLCGADIYSPVQRGACFRGCNVIQERAFPNAPWNNHMNPAAPVQAGARQRLREDLAVAGLRNFQQVKRPE